MNAPARDPTGTAADTARLETFSDGVFAIAITLLILEIRLPDTDGSLARSLIDAWPSYTAYVLSFVTIGIMWANHHAIMRLIERCSHGLIVANLLLLMSISFLPFPTHVLAEHLTNPHERRSAALFYSGCFIIIAVCFQIMWTTASWRNRLILPGSEKAAAEITRSYRWGIPSYTACTLVALVSPVASIALVALMALFWLIPRGRTDG